MTRLSDGGAGSPVDGVVGRGLNPFAGFRDAISKEEAGTPEVRTELQRRFRHTIHFATVGTIPTAIGFGALIWFMNRNAGIVVWVMASLTTLGLWLWALRRPIDLDWLPLATALQLYGGVIWGGLPLVAMPGDERWQLFMAAFGMGVQASSVLFAAQIRRLFYAFHIPNAVLSLAGFFFLADGVGRWGAALLAYSAAFAAGLSELHHLTALSASTFSVRAARLAAGLSSKSDALSQANERLATQARTDPLTGLANRYAFDRRLGKALESGPDPSSPGADVLAIAMLDLDRFKSINDSLGHRVGDLLLVAVGHRLRQRLAPGEVLARFGGDELVVMSPAVTRGSGMTELGRRLASAFDEPFVVEGRRMEIGASIGVADSSFSTDPGDLLRFADAALYQGKHQGGRRVELFDAALERRLRERRQIEDEVSFALGDGQLVPYLQPFVDIETGLVTGAESLVRWLHPDGVRIAGSFFEVVEELGLVDQLTDHPLDTLDESGLLDDFGIGFSSLARAAKLDVDGYKLDRLFVAELASDRDARAVMAGVVEIAARQQREIIAEGVETMEQARILADFGVSTAQGFLYSPAVSFDEFELLVADRHRFAPIAGSARDDRVWH